VNAPRSRLSRRRVIATCSAILLTPAAARAAASGAQIEAEGRAALQKLYGSSPRARELGAKAQAILVFPKIKKAGLMIGGQGGKGVLFVKGKSAGFFSIYAGSFGLQAGAQTFSYALFIVTHTAMDYLTKSKGWAIGSGPSVVMVDEGFARTMNTTTLSQDVYAMPFGQKGLMAGMGLEGSKITPISPD
jgi:lipid-binding SYLF domain-containing protein